MLVYVDDLIITGNNSSHMSRFIDSLSQRFSLKYLDDLSFFLGMEVTRSQEGLHLTQTRYIADLLHRKKWTRASQSPRQCVQTQPSLSTPVLPYKMLRSIVQLSGVFNIYPSRAQIFPVNKLSQFMHHPTIDHWNAVKRITDADWGGKKDDYTSTSAYIAYLGHYPIAWSSKKQKGVSRSST